MPQLSDQPLFQFAVLTLSGIVWSVVNALLVTDYRGALTRYTHRCWLTYQRPWYQRTFLWTASLRARYADENWVRRTFRITAVIGLAVSFVVSLAITSVLFAAILKYLPAKQVDWGDVWIGGFVTALLFELGKILLGIYLGSSSSFSSLGAAGALIALLFWVYYTAQIFLFGAAFTRVYAERHQTATQRPFQGRQQARIGS